MLNISETLDLLDQIENDRSCSEDESARQQSIIYEKLSKDLRHLIEESSKEKSHLNGNVHRRRHDENDSSSANSQQNFIRTNMEYNNKKESASPSAITVREAFANNSTSSLSKLPPRLASLMTLRVATEKLLPQTQDDTANEEIMNSSKTAITLTRPALIAAQLYAQLLAMPGAWGTGLVEMEALGAMSALFRRWRVECCGREEESIKSATTANKRKKTKKPAPKKRVRKGGRTVAFEGYDSSASESTESSASVDLSTRNQDYIDTSYEFDLQGAESSSFLSQRELLLLGFIAGQNACLVPGQKEFMNWSSESREAMIETVASLYGTAAAFGSKWNSNQRKSRDNYILQLQNSIVQDATHSLKSCILVQEVQNQSVLEGIISNDSLTKRHETTVFIFRGLLPILSMKDTLPYGESGRQAAFAVAVQFLDGFVKGISEEMANKQLPNDINTPSRSRQSRVSFVPTPHSTKSPYSAGTPFSTGRKIRKKKGENAMSQETPPALKASRTPQRFSISSARRNPNRAQPRPILSAVLGLLQKLVTTKGLERAEFRGNIVDAVMCCLQHLPLLERTHLLRFLVRCSQSKVSLHRLVGTELVGTTLCESWLWKEHSPPQPMSPTGLQLRLTGEKTPGSERRVVLPWNEEFNEDMPVILFDTLTGRLLDKIPTVRTRAANLFAKIFRNFRDNPEDVENQDDFDQQNPLEGLKRCISLHGDALSLCLRKRASMDGKATVRKASTEALAELFLVGQLNDKSDCLLRLSDTEVAILSHLCQDFSMQTRKAAAQSLTLLLEHYRWNGSSSKIQELLERSWATSVLPLALDTENSCVSKGVDLSFQVLIEPIIPRNGLDDQRKVQTAWRVLGSIGENSGLQGAARGEMAALRASLTKIQDSDILQRDLKTALLDVVSRVASATLIEGQVDLYEPYIEAQRAGVWCLFDALVGEPKDLQRFKTKLKRVNIDLDFLRQCWDKMLELSDTPSLSNRSLAMLRASLRSCLYLISKLASLLEESGDGESGRALQLKLENFLIPTELIGSAVSALAAITVSQSDESSAAAIRKQCSEWIKAVYDSCESIISSYVAGNSRNENAELLLARALFTVGELALVGFSPDEDDTLPATAHSSTKTDSNSVLIGLQERPRKKLVELVQALLSHDLPGSDSVPTPGAVRAHAFISIGKICLRDKVLAKDCITVLARELHESIDSGSPKVQSNALLVLGDLCVRYTNMVDRYLPVMAVCLQTGNSSSDQTLFHDDAAIVRKHAVLLLSSLILQDYIKWRGLLFHRFLVASADKDESVANLAEKALCGPLLTKQPKLFFNQFVESLFVLNRCTAHPVYLAAAASGDGGGGITVGFEGIQLTGSAGRAQRHKMYQTMLSKMRDEEKIAITARLAKEVLSSALDSHTDLHQVCTNPLTNSSERGNKSKKSATYESAFNVLSDAFAVLSSPELRVGKGASHEDDLIDDPVPNTSKKVNAVKGKLLSKISRKHLIEIVLPILCSLKTSLQSNCSPLLKDLMHYMVELFRGYKDEVKDFLSNDPNLLQEIEYDARQARRGTVVVSESEDDSDYPGRAVLSPSA